MRGSRSALCREDAPLNFGDGALLPPDCRDCLSDAAEQLAVVTGAALNVEQPLPAFVEAAHQLVGVFFDGRKKVVGSETFFP
jgi:hypothetical protein